MTEKTLKTISIDEVKYDASINMDGVDDSFNRVWRQKYLSLHVDREKNTVTATYTLDEPGSIVSQEFELEHDLFWGDE